MTQNVRCDTYILVIGYPFSMSSATLGDLFLLSLGADECGVLCSLPTDMKEEVVWFQLGEQTQPI